jgi:hypothetical protein
MSPSKKPFARDRGGVGVGGEDESVIGLGGGGVGSASAKGMLILRHRMECETGARDFAAACGVKRPRRGGDSTSRSASSSPTAAGAAAIPSSATIEKHVATVCNWFAANVSLLRGGSGVASGSSRGSAPLPSAAALPDSTRRALEQQYEQLFAAYRAELQANLSAAPAAQQTILARLQWHAVAAGKV